MQEEEAGWTEMTLGEQIDLSVHLELVEPIRGHVGSGDGRVRTFTGWLEFNSAIIGLIGEAETGRDFDEPAGDAEAS